MKKIMLLMTMLLCILLLSINVQAYQYGIKVGDRVKQTSHGPTGGGEFTMKADYNEDDVVDYEWLSFCLETNEVIYGNQYDWVGGLTDYATQGGTGGGSPDYLSDESAWLYWNFWTGNLTNYTYGDDQDEEDLQSLIWYLEEERTTYSDNEGWLTDAQNAIAAGWTNDGRVKVANLYETRSGSPGAYTYCGDRQDVLVPGEPVPEPATMLLLGSGLIGLAGLGRKKFFKKST